MWQRKVPERVVDSDNNLQLWLLMRNYQGRFEKIKRSKTTSIKKKKICLVFGIFALIRADMQFYLYLSFSLLHSVDAQTMSLIQGLLF